jgi:hypothetical protein
LRFCQGLLGVLGSLLLTVIGTSLIGAHDLAIGGTIFGIGIAANIVGWVVPFVLNTVYGCCRTACAHDHASRAAAAHADSTCLDRTLNTTQPLRQWGWERMKDGWKNNDRSKGYTHLAMSGTIKGGIYNFVSLPYSILGSIGYGSYLACKNTGETDVDQSFWLKVAYIMVCSAGLMTQKVLLLSDEAAQERNPAPAPWAPTSDEEIAANAQAAAQQAMADSAVRAAAQQGGFTSSERRQIENSPYHPTWDMWKKAFGGLSSEERARAESAFV